MLEDARSQERRFDVICVHAFSRFYRNGAEMELTIRNLRKHGVEVVSVTQPTGTDPSQEMMRQIIGIFDEYTSKENGKNVLRSMRENAKQGFWNGATPPLGYKTVEAEKRGSTIKKRLVIDPVEAETIKLIFKLYLEGDGTSVPLGIKNIAQWLNSHGYRTRLGATFGVGPVHAILNNRAYATGKWPYGRRNARSGDLNDPASIVEIDIPPIISVDDFEKVRARLAHNNPNVTPPRIVNGPSLLTGITVCASCGLGMTMTGTRKRQRTYSYYSCAGCKQRGRAVCQGRHIPMAKLDNLVLQNIKDRLLQPDRLRGILAGLIDRKAAQDADVQKRRHALEAERSSIQEKIDRLYGAIENGVIALDADLKARLDALKNNKSIIDAQLQRMQTQAADTAEVTQQRIEAFGAIVRQALDGPNVQVKKAYLRSVISGIEVGDHKIRIFAEKAALAAAVAGRPAAAGNVRGFVRKWCALGESNPSCRNENPES